MPKGNKWQIAESWDNDAHFVSLFLNFFTVYLLYIFIIFLEELYAYYLLCHQ